LDYVQLKFKGTGLYINFMKRILEIRSTENGKSMGPCTRKRESTCKWQSNNTPLSCH